MSNIRLYPEVRYIHQASRMRGLPVVLTLELLHSQAVEFPFNGRDDSETDVGGHWARAIEPKFVRLMSAVVAFGVRVSHVVTS